MREWLLHGLGQRPPVVVRVVAPQRERAAEDLGAALVVTVTYRLRAERRELPEPLSVDLETVG